MQLHIIILAIISWILPFFYCMFFIDDIFYSVIFAIVMNGLLKINIKIGVFILIWSTIGFIVFNLSCSKRAYRKKGKVLKLIEKVLFKIATIPCYILAVPYLFMKYFIAYPIMYLINTYKNKRE